MTIDVVPIAEGHIAGYRAAVDAVARERRWLAMIEAPPMEAVRAFVLANIERGNPHVVALDGAGVAGWCDIVRNPRGMLAHSGVLGMGLLPPYRGQGLGRRMLLDVLRAARDRGFTRVELTVYETNPRAVALYESVGFEREGRMRNYTFVDGRAIDAYLMAISALDRWPEAGTR